MKSAYLNAILNDLEIARSEHIEAILNDMNDNNAAYLTPANNTGEQVYDDSWGDYETGRVD